MVFGYKLKYLSCNGIEKKSVNLYFIFTLSLDKANLLEIRLSLKTDFLKLFIEDYYKCKKLIL